MTLRTLNCIFLSMGYAGCISSTEWQPLMATKNCFGDAEDSRSACCRTRVQSCHNPSLDSCSSKAFPAVPSPKLAPTVCPWHEIPIVSTVVPFWGYLLGSLKKKWLSQRGTAMETIGKTQEAPRSRRIGVEGGLGTLKSPRARGFRA